MRLWTLHPRLLDPKGLVAVWREALLAQAVLLGRTRGYTRHPQLERFRGAADPAAAIGAYLSAVLAEAGARGYRFDGSRIVVREAAQRIWETRGQLDFEWRHLGEKLRGRNPRWFRQHRACEPSAHPLFRIRPGGVRAWERPAPLARD